MRRRYVSEHGVELLEHGALMALRWRAGEGDGATASDWLSWSVS